MRSQSKLIFGLGLAVVIVGGVAALFWLEDPLRSQDLWNHYRSSVLQFGVPPVLAGAGWAVQQLFGPLSGRSTPDELDAARKALSGRGREWSRGGPEPAWPRLLRVGFHTVAATWRTDAPGGAGQLDTGDQPDAARDGEPDASEQRISVRIPQQRAGPNGRRRPTVSGSDVRELAQGLREMPVCRLVVSGPAGSGKSVLARLLMTELLRDLTPAEPVPVFLPAWSWDPRAERLGDWIKRSIAQAYPELADTTCYGPTAIDSLVDQGQILPIIDGVDALPPGVRAAVPYDRQLISLDHVIITCRTGTFDDIDGYDIVSPTAIDTDDARQFLADVMRFSEPRRRRTSRTPDPALVRQLTEPRTLFLASIAYRDAAATKALEQTTYQFASAPDAEDRLVPLLIPATMNKRAVWARSHRRYAAPGAAEKWLGNLARLDLRDPWDSQAGPAEDADPRATDDHPEQGEPDPRLDPGNSRITWWNLYRGVGQLRRWQSVQRALIIAALAFVVTTLDFKYDRGWQYSLMTAGGYAVMVLAAGAILGGGPWRPDRDARRARREAGPLRSWLAGQHGARWRVLLTALVVFCAFGTLIGLRQALENKTGFAVGSRTGLWDGLNNALLIVIAFVLAGVPRPPRTTRATDRGVVSRPGLGEFVLAIVLGVAFGLLWGGSELLRHQGPNPPPLGPALTTGVGTGLFFGLGCWIYAWLRASVRSRPAATPRQAAEQDLAGTIVGTILLGITFAFAFGVNTARVKHGVPIAFTGVDVVAWFIVGVSLALLGSEWPLYLVTVCRLAAKKKIPLRLMRFLECSHSSGVLRVIGREYQIHDDGLLTYLLGDKQTAGQTEAERRTQTTWHDTLKAPTR